jgi:hypothetical protein
MRRLSSFAPARLSGKRLMVPWNALFYWDSVPHCRKPPSAYQVPGRTIPCSDCANLRHDIIPNRLALTAEESVSGVTGGTALGQSGDPTHAHLHHWQ